MKRVANRLEHAPASCLHPRPQQHVMVAEQAGHRQYELRRIERLVPAAVPLLMELTPLPNRAACAAALVRAMDAYLDLTRAPVPRNRIPAAEVAVRRYLAEAIA